MPKPFALQHVLSRDPEPVELDRPVAIQELPTPALVLERAALLRNVEKMKTFLESCGKGFRPHAKTHKCPLISRLQLEAGAVGVCAAKVSEAAALVNAGVDKVLITSPVVTPVKVEVLNDIAAGATELMLVVDSDAGLAALAKHISPDTRLSLVVDMDVAMGRTGTRDKDQLLRLVDAIAGDARFRFAGVQHYAGHVMHIEGFAARREQSLALWERLLEKTACLHEHGFTPEIVTGCGTGTYNIDVEVAEITDLQVGSYIFMDEEYLGIGGKSAKRFDDFEVSLTVACTAISQPTKRAMTFDGGYKSFASETVMPVTEAVPEAKFRFAGDEHGVLIFNEAQQELKLGDVVQFISPHCDPTVNLHEFYWVQEDDGLVHSLWPISARGCSW